MKKHANRRTQVRPVRPNVISQPVQVRPVDSDLRTPNEQPKSTTNSQLAHLDSVLFSEQVKIVKHPTFIAKPQTKTKQLNEPKSELNNEPKNKSVQTEIKQAVLETEQVKTSVSQTASKRNEEAVTKPATPSTQTANAKPELKQTAALLNPSTIIDAQLRQYEQLPKIRRHKKQFDLGNLLIYVLGFFLLVGLTFALWPKDDVFAPSKLQKEDEAELAVHNHMLKVTDKAVSTETPEMTVAMTTEAVDEISKSANGNIYYSQSIGPKLCKNSAKDLKLPHLAPLTYRPDKLNQKYKEWGIQHSKQTKDGERLPVIDDECNKYVVNYNVLFDLNREVMQDVSSRYASYLADEQAKAHNHAKQANQTGETEVEPSQSQVKNKQQELSAAQKANAKYRPNKVVYLTYDFPTAELLHAKSVLDTLELYQASATFFISGEFLTEAPNLVLRMQKEEHAIGSLGWEPIDAARLAIRNENTFLNHLTKLDKNFQLLTGRPLDSFFRPSEGSYSEQALFLIRNAGYYPTFWGVELHNFWPDSKDTLNYRYDNLRNRNFNIDPYPFTVEQAINRILQDLHDGLIIRLDGRSKVDVALLEPLIKKLQAKGYRCLNLNEIPLNVIG